MQQDWWDSSSQACIDHQLTYTTPIESKHENQQGIVGQSKNGLTALYAPKASLLGT